MAVRLERINLLRQLPDLDGIKLRAHVEQVLGVLLLGVDSGLQDGNQLSHLLLPGQEVAPLGLQLLDQWKQGSVDL